MPNFSSLVIANPKSGGGKTAWLQRRLSTLLAAQLPKTEIVWTGKPREATTLAHKALQEGTQMIVAAGGDGTVNEVVNGFFDGNSGKLLREDAVLGILPLGSGQDFVHSLDWKPYLKPSIERLAGKKTIACDVGLMNYRSMGGAVAHRYFLNIADVGMAPEAMKRINPFPKFFGARLAYLQGIVRSLATYRKRYVELVIDDRHKGNPLITNIFIANGKSNGAGWRVCPDAKLDDGLFDILVVGDIRATELLRALPKLYRGNKLDHPELRYYRGKHVKVLEAESEYVSVEADGEPLGYIPAEFVNLHHKIRIKV